MIYPLKSFIIQGVFIQSYKLDMFWKAEKTEKHIQSFSIENPFKFQFSSKTLLPPTTLLSWKPKKLGRFVLYKVIEKLPVLPTPN